MGCRAAIGALAESGMSYVVLARKWRPMDFSDLVGQDHVSKTLGSAIASGRVAHAFLFTGVRGVGKTTSARILAKALNCMGDPSSDKTEVDPGPTVNPCLKCPACQEIATGSDMDVREIDGASYNGVDEVRKLQDSLPYRPTRDRYKIIIVDEVHMLSGAAWNAFLKTLEEPPSHVKFIFATTEAHKVPVTILSRVQRFDFKLIPTRVIAERLRYVLEQENIDAEDSAVLLLARQAAGSMRDGMSLLDQVIAFGSERLTGEDVARVLGVASRSALLEIARALVGGEPESCVRLVSQVADQGFDIAHVARDLLGLLRDLVVSRICSEPGDLLDLADEERQAILELGQKAGESDLLRLHQGFSRGFDDITRGADPRSNLEMLLVRLALRPPLLPLDELLQRIGALEKRLAQGAPGRSGGRGGGGTAAQGRGLPPASGGNRSPAPSSSPIRGSSDTSTEQASVPERPETASRAGEMPKESPRARAASQPSKRPPEQPDALPPQERSNKAFDSSPQEPSQQASLVQVSPEHEERLEKMMRVCAHVREKHMELAAYLEQTVPLQCDGSRLSIALEPGYLFEKKLTSSEGRAILESSLKELWGPSAHLEIIPESEHAHPNQSVAKAKERKRQAERAALVEEVKNHPRIRQAVDVLGAKLRDVRLPEAP